MDGTAHVIGDTCADVLKAEELLRSIPVGQVVTYETLRAELGLDVRGDKRYVLAQARKHLERDAVVYEAVRGVGYKRLDDVQTVKTSVGYIRKARNAARRGVIRATAVADYNSLPNEVKVQHNTVASLCGAIVEVTKAHFIKQLRQHVEVAQKMLPASQTLEHFSGK